MQSRAIKAGLLGLGKALTTLVRLASAIILVRILTKAEYANYRQVLLPVFMVMPFLSLGLPQALLYFLPQTKERAKGLLFEVLLMLGSMGFLFSLFFLFGGNRIVAHSFGNPEISPALIYIASYAFLALPTMAISGCLVAMNRNNWMAIYDIFTKLVLFAMVTLAALNWQNYQAPVLAWLVSGSLFLVPSILLMFKACPASQWRPQLSEMIELVKYSVPLAFSSMLYLLGRNLDKLIVALMCPKELFAVYVIAAIEIPVINIVTSSVATILIPDFTRLHQAQRYDEMMTIWNRSIVKCALILLPTMCYFFFMAETFLTMMFSDRYLESATVFRLYLFLLPLRTITANAIFLAVGQTRIPLFRNIGVVVLNCILSLVLVHNIGYIGACIGTLLAFYLWQLPFNLVHLTRIFRVKIIRLLPLNKLASVMLCSLLPCVIFLFPEALRLDNKLLDLCTTAVVYGCMSIFLMHRMQLVNIRALYRSLYASVALRLRGS